MTPKIKRIVDLTQPFYHNCPGPPIFPLPQVERTNMAPRDVFNMERLSIEGAKYLVQKKILGVGIDRFSLSGNEFETVPPHIELLKSDIWIIEDMFLPRELLEVDSWHVIALPMLLKDGSGSPVRAVAVEYCDDERKLLRAAIPRNDEACSQYFSGFLAQRGERH